MPYLVLARKFRPQNFNEIIGQEHVSRTLKNAISEKRVAHAYLFSGPRGCGKTTTARILAKALNCKKGPTTEPCGTCENCTAISKSSSIDVLEIDGASNNGIDEIRALRENVKFSSANSKYKIYIIDEAHQITTQAFNALLKTLEEPPPHVVFIMATTEQHKIPATILSRCQRYRFKLIPSAEISSALKSIGRKEGFEIDEEALNILTSASGGSMRDALSLLDQAASSGAGKITGGYIRELLGLLPKEILASVTENIAKGDMQAILKTVEEIFKEGYNILQFARDLRDHLRKVMVYSINPPVAEVSCEDEKLFESQKTLFSVARHVRMNNLLSKALEEMRWHDQPRIILEMYLLKMSEPYYNVGELIEKIAELEKSIKIEEGAESVIENRLPAQSKEKAASGISASAGLAGVWNEIVSELIKKHPLTAQSLNNASVKAVGVSAVKVSVSKEFDYAGVLEFKDMILELFRSKTGIDVAMEVLVENNAPADRTPQEESVIEEENLSLDSGNSKENFNEKAEAAIPERIKEIAESFGAVVKRI